MMLFRDAWMEQAGQTQFTTDESQHDIRRIGERLVAKYMDEVAPTVEPAAVELDVHGEISGVPVRGRVDLLDVEGRLIDFKTASRRPSWVSPDYAFQLATYRQITPGASGEVRIDSLVKTDGAADRAARLHGRGVGHSCHPGPVSDGAGGHGLGDVLSEPPVNALQPEALRVREAVRRGVRRPGSSLEQE